MKIKRNEKCPCGSGAKYKNCCYKDHVKNTEITRAAFLASTSEELISILSAPSKVYRLKVVLIRMRCDEFNQEISRTFEVEDKHSLYDFHMDIQHAFDWDNDHMFSFYFGGKLFDRENEYSATPFGEHKVSEFGIPSKSAVAAQMRDLNLTENSTFLYLFDYGDELVHEVHVEKIFDKTAEAIYLPSVVATTGTVPNQYGEFE